MNLVQRLRCNLYGSQFNSLPAMCSSWGVYLASHCSRWDALRFSRGDPCSFSQTGNCNCMHPWMQAQTSMSMSWLWVFNIPGCLLLFSGILRRWLRLLWFRTWSISLWSDTRVHRAIQTRELAGSSLIPGFYWFIPAKGVWMTFMLLD